MEVARRVHIHFYNYLPVILSTVSWVRMHSSISNLYSISFQKALEEIRLSNQYFCQSDIFSETVFSRRMFYFKLLESRWSASVKGGLKALKLMPFLCAASLNFLHFGLLPLGQSSLSALSEHCVNEWFHIFPLIYSISFQGKQPLRTNVYVQKLKQKSRHSLYYFQSSLHI